MRSLLQNFLLLALFALALAAPTPEPVPKRSFKVERIRNPKFKGRSPGAGTRSLIKAYRKFGVPLPPGLLAAMAEARKGGNGGSAGVVQTGGGKSHGASTTGTPMNQAVSAATNGSGMVTATPVDGDLEYLAPISIGGQTIVMDFDTGSSDLWVFNTGLPAADQMGHTNFNPETSATFELMPGASFAISYGDGSMAAGKVGTDTVNIGGATVTGQAVELPTALTASFVDDTNSNGLVGLAFPKLNTVKPVQQNTFFANAMDTLAEPVFTADLRHDAVGAYEFGAIDSTKFNGPLSWAAINTTAGFWQFSSQSFAVGTGAVMTVPGGQAIADTGTTLMLVNAAIVNAYYSQVQGAVNNETVGGVTFPCDADLPNLQVDIGGNYMALIRADDINFAPVDAGSTTCFGGLQATTGDLQIYGDIMFKSQFVAFNGGNNSIGMAPHQ